MSDSSGDEGALQIDIERSNESVRGGGGKTVSGKAKKGWEPGDVVWAKVTGFNYWPAKVPGTHNYTQYPYCSPKHDKLCVSFIVAMVILSGRIIVQDRLSAFLNLLPIMIFLFTCNK